MVEHSNVGVGEGTLESEKWCNIGVGEMVEHSNVGVGEGTL
jgi:hypothetical protein